MAGSANPVAPGLPAASVDFNALNDALAKNPNAGKDAVEAATFDREQTRLARKPHLKAKAQSASATATKAAPSKKTPGDEKE